MSCGMCLMRRVLGVFVSEGVEDHIVEQLADGGMGRLREFVGVLLL